MDRLQKYDVFDVPMVRIHIDSGFNCRGEFALHSVHDLAESMRSKGLDFPVVIRPASDVPGGLDGFDYHLICGHRRCRAAEFLGWRNIPSMIRSGLTDREARLLNLTENLERNDLNPLEEAQAMRNLFPEGTAVKTITEELKRSFNWVRARLDLLGMPFEIQQYVAARMLSQNDLEGLMKVPEDQRLEAARRVVRGDRQPLDAYKAKKRMNSKKRRTDVSRMIERLFEAGIDGLPTLLLAWVMGGVPDEDLEFEIVKESARYRGSSVVERDDDNDHSDTSNPDRLPSGRKPEDAEAGDNPHGSNDLGGLSLAGS